MYQPLRIEGRSVILEEIQPKYFANVIGWRNNKELNQFLNQPYELTMELEQKWFEKYIEDDTQGLMIMIDGKSGVAFGTVGWTDLNRKEKVCISGRVLVGNQRFSGTLQFIEGIILANDYLYQVLDLEKMYCHIVKENIKSVDFSKKMGFVEVTEACKYPNELFVNGMEQIEYSRTKEQYLRVRKWIGLK